jgi:methylphosphotriester-DNA--protein-cysteine methyltransferase
LFKLRFSSNRHGYRIRYAQKQQELPSSGTLKDNRNYLHQVRSKTTGITFIRYVQKTTGITFIRYVQKTTGITFIRYVQKTTGGAPKFNPGF